MRGALRRGILALRQGGEAGAFPQRAGTGEAKQAEGKRAAARRVFFEEKTALFVLAHRPLGVMLARRD